VIDQINTIPFFTPLWADIPRFVMMWQLAREVWWYESRFPLNAIGYALEPLYLRVYRHTPVITFSRSTEADLRGLGLRGPIHVIPPGIEMIEPSHVAKTEEPSFIYVGRIAPSKRIEDIVNAFAIYRRSKGHGRLLLVGSGSHGYVARVLQLAENLRVRDSIEHAGWLRGEVKYRRMTESHALLMASVREGWGLVVTESNSCGTPAVVYDVPGLRDSVRNGETGLVVPPNPRGMAEGMLQLTGDCVLYRRLQDAALRWSRSFNYDAMTSAVSETLVAGLARGAA
jgi:glycosyltransferase involved in cell wall biosynthesis